MLPVILFHGGNNWFSGGFVGVDVFFVISGYLITSIIVAECESGSFSLLGFYERRARRILPALIAVVLACMPFAYLWMAPYQLIDFSESVIAISLFASNFLFWQETGYFNPAAELKPLLHTWSLAVEEQYYIGFPLFIIAMWRFGRKAIVASIIVAVVLSLGIAEYLAQRSIAAANFYLLTSRAWELLLGSLVALVIQKRERVAGYRDQVLAALGLVMIIYAIVDFSRATPFPGLYAVIPALGTALIIMYAIPGTLVARMLSIRPLVGIGLISYSAYLWHQPIFAFARIRSNDNPGSTVFLGLSVLALLLAWASWHYVEQPFRNKRRFARNKIFAMSGGAIAALILAGGISVANDGFVDRFPASDRDLLVTNPGDLGRYVERKFRELAKNEFTVADDRYRVLIIGDSFAQDFVNMAYENDYLSAASVVTFGIANRCPVYIGPEDIEKLYKSAGLRYDKHYCENFSNLSDAQALVRAADIVILAASWKMLEAERVEQTIVSLTNGATDKIIVIGHKHFGKFRPVDLVAVPRAERGEVFGTVPTTHFATNEAIKYSVREYKLVDVLGMFCTDGRQCPLFTPESKLISYDGAHFTADGAKYVGEIVFKHPLLLHLK